MSATVQFNKPLAFKLILHKLPTGHERGSGVPTRRLLAGTFEMKALGRKR